jgi:hypothetical protein
LAESGWQTAVGRDNPPQWNYGTPRQPVIAKLFVPADLCQPLFASRFQPTASSPHVFRRKLRRLWMHSVTLCATVN